jgi:hypothetical protein
MNARPAPRPRSRPHRFRADPLGLTDYAGAPLCRCGSLQTAAVHRDPDPPPPPPPYLLDVARLAAGDTDDD